MSIFIQEVLGLLNRNQKKITLDKTKDWFEFGKLYQSSSLNNKSAYTPKMDPFVIKWGDLVCQATQDLTRTLPGEGKLGYIPVYTDPSGTCSWDTLKDSIITQNTLNTIINIAGSLTVAGDVQISGGDLTATTSTFNLLNTAPVSLINFGSTTTNIEIGGSATVVNVNGTTQSTSCTTGALVIDGGVGIAKNLYVCNDLNVAGDAAINGGDLTSTVTTFNLLNQSVNINFGNTSQNILIGGLNATSTVQIVGTQESTLCTNGALIVAGGVGIAKNLNVCGNLTITGTSNLNGNVNLGDAIGDNIRLFGILLDNNGTTASANQVLIAQTGGSALWTSPPWITSFAVAGNTGTAFDITQANTLSILGGTALTTVTSSVDTVTINHLNYGTAGTYTYPSSITTNAQGHVISVTSATSPITANNGLTMSTPTNVQLGGTLIQNTTISGGASTAYDLTIIDGDIRLDKGAGAGGLRGNLHINNDRNINWGGTTIFISGSTANGGLSYGVPLTDKHTFYSSVKFNEYGTGVKTGTPTFNLSVTSAGDIIETQISAAPKVFVALISQSGIASAPTMTVLSDFSSGGITFTWNYISPGLYSLQATQPVFFATKTAYYITADYNAGKSYCAAVERSTDTILLVNSFVANTGASDDSLFTNATLKIEIYT